MASGGSLAPKGKEEDFRHTCSLCMEPYRGRSPKLLPCYHTFCLPCLTALEASVRSAKPDTQVTTDDDAGEKESDDATKTPTCNDDIANQDDVKLSFPCPTCRAPVPIPEGGVASLQTNFYLDHEPGPNGGSSSVLCDMCEEENQQSATHTCQECQLGMCRTCRRYHDIMARDHHVTPVGLSQPAKVKREKKGLCLVHQDQILCFHCCQCDVSICLHCKLTSHEGHKTVEIASAALKAREEITSLIPSAQRQLQVVAASLQQVNRDKRELTHQAQEVTRQIHARYDTLMTWASRSRDRLLEDLSAMEASAQNRLDAETASGVLLCDILSNALSGAAHSTAADPRVMTWRKELTEALLSKDVLAQHQQRADCKDCSQVCHYDISDSFVLCEEDIRAYMGRVVEGADDDNKEGASRVSLLLNELATKMNELTLNTSALTARLDSCTDDITKLQIRGDTLQKKGDELKKETASLQIEITTSRQAETDLLKTTQTLKENLGKARQLFYAFGLNTDKLKRNKAMTFRITQINDGGHYNERTGVFTAPLRGLYIVTAGLEDKNKDNTVYGHIKVDDDLRCVVAGSYEGGSACVPVLLTPGQKVWIETRSNKEHYGDDYYYCSTFSVTLMLPSL